MNTAGQPPADPFTARASNPRLLSWPHIRNKTLRDASLIEWPAPRRIAARSPGFDCARLQRRPVNAN
jgi:hypothetical protein